MIPSQFLIADCCIVHGPTFPLWTGCEAQFSDIMNKVSAARKHKPKKPLLDQLQEAGDRAKIQQIVDMYGVSADAAVLAFQALGYDDAVDQLSIAESRQHYEDMVRAQEAETDDDEGGDHHNERPRKRKKKGYGYGMRLFGGLFGAQKSDGAESKEDDPSTAATSLPDFKAMIRTSSGGNLQCVAPQNIYRSIVVMNGHNFLLRCLCFALKVLLNGNRYCMICDKALAFAGLKPTICSERFCQWYVCNRGTGERNRVFLSLSL